VSTLGAIAYSFSAALFIQEQSDAPHIEYLANAFAHRRTYLDKDSPNAEENDWTYYQGRWMVSFPPTPTLLMMPFVAIAGTDFNDTVFTLLFGAKNVVLIYEKLPLVGQPLKNSFEITLSARIALTMVFGFGTVHWWLTSFGQV